MRRRVLSLAVVLVSCAGATPDRDRLPPPQPTRTPVAAQLATARSVLRTFRQRAPVSPKRFREQRCEALDLRGLSKLDRELPLRVVDARIDTRHVLPLRLTGQLTEPDLNQLDDVLAGVENSGARPSAACMVESLARKRFVGVYHVVHYESPKWVVRIGAPKSGWDAGRLDAWFAVHDAQHGEALCETRLTAIGDASSAPRSVRLRSETRDQLQAALGERLRRSTIAALARMGAADFALQTHNDFPLAQL